MEEHREMEVSDALNEDILFADKLIYKNRERLYDKLVMKYNQSKLQAVIKICELVGLGSKKRCRHYYRIQTLSWMQTIYTYHLNC